MIKNIPVSKTDWNKRYTASQQELAGKKELKKRRIRDMIG